MTETNTIDDVNYKKLAELAARENTTIPEVLERAVQRYLEESTKGSPAGGVSNEHQGATRTPSAKLAEVFNWNPENGRISFELTNRRVFIMAARAWEILEDALFIKFSEGASTLLTEMGLAYGKSIAVDYGSLTRDPENMKGYFELLGSVAGWGLILVEGDLDTGSKIKLRIDNCIFCRRGVSTTIKGKTACFFLMGVSKGIIDALFDWPHTASEKRCRLRGDEFCEIELRDENPLQKPSRTKASQSHRDPLDIAARTKG